MDNLIWVQVDNNRIRAAFLDKEMAIREIEEYLSGPGMEFKRLESSHEIRWVKRDAHNDGDWVQAHNRLKAVPIITGEPQSGDDRGF